MDIGAYIGHGWNTFKANPGPFIVVTVAVMLANTALSILGSFLPFMLGSLVSFGVSGLTLGALAQMGLKGSRGQAVELGDIAVVLERPVDFVVVGLATSIGVLGCFVGVVVTQALFMFAAFLVLGGVGYQDALSASLNASKARFMDVLLLVIVMFVLNMLGVLTCGLGLLVTIPVGFIALAKAFDDLAITPPGAMVTPAPPQQQLP